MNSPSKYVLVIAGSLLVGIFLFVSSFVVMDFAWTHFVVPNPKDTGLGDGVVVVGGGFIIGCILGVSGIVFTLYKFWPPGNSK
jgi:hypothetical protein